VHPEEEQFLKAFGLGYGEWVNRMTFYIGHKLLQVLGHPAPKFGPKTLSELIGGRDALKYWRDNLQKKVDTHQPVTLASAAWDKITTKASRVLAMPENVGKLQDVDIQLVDELWHMAFWLDSPPELRRQAAEAALDAYQKKVLDSLHVPSGNPLTMLQGAVTAHMTAAGFAQNRAQDVQRAMQRMEQKAKDTATRVGAGVAVGVVMKGGISLVFGPASVAALGATAFNRAALAGMVVEAVQEHADARQQDQTMGMLHEAAHPYVEKYRTARRDMFPRMSRGARQALDD
jgi:hypothetical protein